MLILTRTGNRSPRSPPRPHRSTRVFCSRYLTVTEHQPRHRRNAIASPHSYIQKLGLGVGSHRYFVVIASVLRFGPSVAGKTTGPIKPIKASVKPDESGGFCHSGRAGLWKVPLLRASPHRGARLLIHGDVISTRQGARRKRK